MVECIFGDLFSFFTTLSLVQNPGEGDGGLWLKEKFIKLGSKILVKFLFRFVKRNSQDLAKENTKMAFCP